MDISNNVKTNTTNNLNTALLNNIGTASSSTSTKNALNSIAKSSSLTSSIVSDYVALSTSSIDNLYAITGDSIVSGLNLVQTATDALSEMQDDLSMLQGVLDDLDSYDDKETVLSLLDEWSNDIINNVIDIYNNTEYNGIKVFSGEASSSQSILNNYQNFVYSLGGQSDISTFVIDTTINLEGLQDIQGLNLDDEDYSSKLQDIIDAINTKNEELSKQMKTLTNLSESYESSDTKWGNSNITFDDIKSIFTNNTDTTLQTISSGISPDLLLQFVNK